MERRELLRTLGAAAVTAAAVPGFAQHEHHHGGMAKNQALINAAGNCSSKAEVCLSHCQELLAQGDKSMAACAATTREVAVACTALRSLAAQSAPSLAQYAKVTAEVCSRCEAECRKHEKQHQVCKDCADACAACRAECAKVSA